MQIYSTCKCRKAAFLYAFLLQTDVYPPGKSFKRVFSFAGKGAYPPGETFQEAYPFLRGLSSGDGPFKIAYPLLKEELYPPGSKQIFSWIAGRGLSGNPR